MILNVSFLDWNDKIAKQERDQNFEALINKFA